jgi:PAS domain S-box-containing protein
MGDERKTKAQLLEELKKLRRRLAELEDEAQGHAGSAEEVRFFPEPSSLSEAVEGLKPHDHLCLIYESQEEWRAAMIPFLEMGLRRGEKCIYIVDARTARQVRRYLRQEGVDVTAVEASGQLSVLPGGRAYMQGGTFHPDRMIALLKTETEKALAEGYPALRVTWEMSWALRGHPGSERLLEYEAKLNRDFFSSYPCLAICQYDRWKFDPEIIKGVIMTHPLLVRGGQVYHNFYYIPPEEFLDQKRGEREVQHWLNNIERERAGRERMEFLAGVLDRSSQPFRVLHPDGRMVTCNRAFCELVGYSEEELRSAPGAFADQTPPEWQGLEAKAIRELRRTGQPQRYEKELVSKGGYRVPVELLLDAARDAEGNVRYYYSFVTDITERKQAEKALRESERSIRKLAEASVKAHEEERQWVALEVHDRIAQPLVSVHQQLQRLKSMTKANPAAKQVLERALTLQQEAIRETRNIMYDLYPPGLNELGLAPLIEEELHRLRKSMRCRTRLYADCPVRPPSYVEVTLYRILREALTNVERHATGVRRVTVSLKCGEEDISLQVQDDGPGFEVEAALQGKLVGGLTSMRRRAEIIGGTFELSSTPGQGTSITVRLPAK